MPFSNYLNAENRLFWVLLKEKCSFTYGSFILFSCLTIIQNLNDLLGTKRVLLRRAYSPLAPNRPTFESLRDLFYRRKAFSGLARGGLDWREAYNSAPLHLREHNGVNPILNFILNPNLNPINEPHSKP